MRSEAAVVKPYYCCSADYCSRCIPYYVEKCDIEKCNCVLNCLSVFHDRVLCFRLFSLSFPFPSILLSHAASVSLRR